MTVIEERSACALVWGDGWGDHTCSRPEGHYGRHRCTCDTWSTAPWDQYAQPHEDT